MSLRLEINAVNADDFAYWIKALSALVPQPQIDPTFVDNVLSDPLAPNEKLKALLQEPTPLEAAIATAKVELGQAMQTSVEAAEKPKGRGRPRKAQTSEAPAGALTGGLSPSVPASQPAVENTGSDSLPPSPSVGDVAVESPAAVAQAPVAAGADAKTMRTALQELSARIGGNEGLDAVAEVIGKFGFNKVSQITPDQHDAIIAAAAAYQKD